MYILNIVKREKLDSLARTAYSPMETYNDEQVLNVALTEGEFNAVKIAVLEHMKACQKNAAN